MISEAFEDRIRVAAQSESLLQDSTATRARYKVTQSISAITWVCSYHWWVSRSPIVEKRHILSSSLVLPFAGAPREEQLRLVQLWWV